MSDTMSHIVIRASAGTGKTYQLTNRFIGLLAAGVPPEQILATTFTRKAAGEIADRVLLRLAQAATDDKACRELATAIGEKSLTPAKTRKLLALTARNLHRLRVGTLDSYFLQIAGGHALELALPPGWTICEELVDATIRDRAIEEVLARGKLADLLALVNLLAKGEAVRSISRIVQDTVTSLFTLHRQTDCSAWETIKHTKGLSPDQLDALCERIAAFPMPNLQWAKARDGDLEKARLGEWEKLIANGLASKVLCGEQTYYKKPIPGDLAELYRKLLGHAESILVGQLAQQTVATRRLLERFAEQYCVLQMQQRALRFDDVTHCLALATGASPPPQWAFRLDGAVRHLLLDEFQDTAPVQWQVLRPLAQQLTQTRRASEAVPSSFFCVGDTKQAIYGWRGGLAEIFDALEGELTGLTCDTLAKSYRSAQPIIDTVNRVFTRLTQHPNLDKLAPAVTQWQEQFPPHTTAKTDLAGYVRMEFSPTASEDEDSASKHYEFAADAIARQVAELPQCSVGVLVRTNAAVGRMIYLLRRREVPASEEGGNPLIDSPAVELILSLLRLADHPGDKVARFHLAQSPLAQPLELADHQSDAAAAHLARRIRRQLLDEGYGPVVFHYAQRLAACCDRRDQSRLQQLVELAYDYQPAASLRTDDFVRLVEKRKIADPSAADVRVMTIHQAKGLEFDVVMLPELDGLLTGQAPPLVVGRPGPTQPIDVVCRYANEHVRKFLPPRIQALFEEDTRRTVSESLCVLYVAMTRAVHALHMILPPPKANERNLPKTFAGLLRATLAPAGATGGLLHEHGDPDWFTQLKRKPAAAAEDPAAPAKIALAPARPDRDRGLGRTSPSALEGGQRISPARLLQSKAQAFEHGDLVHACLAELHWLDDGWPPQAKLAAAARRKSPGIASDPKLLQSKLALVRGQAEAAGIAAVLRRAFYDHPRNLGFSDPSVASWKSGEVTLEVFTERPFAIRDGDEILTGSIDRLVLIRRGGQLIAADVLDFKTDAVLTDRIAFYTPQLQAYCKAVAQTFRLEPRRIAARLVFLSAGTVVAIS